MKDEDTSRRLKTLIELIGEQYGSQSKRRNAFNKGDPPSLELLEQRIQDFIQFINQKTRVQQILRSYRIQARRASNINELYKITVDHLLKFLSPDNISFRAISADGKYLLPEYAHYPTKPELYELFRTTSVPVETDKLIQEAFRKKTIVIVKNAEVDPRVNKELALAFNNKSILMCPLLTHSEIIGLWGCAYTQSVHVFSDLEVELVQNLSENLSLELERLKINKQEKNQRLQLEVFSNLSAEIISLQTLEGEEKKAFSKIASEIIRVSDYERVLISIFDEKPPHTRKIVASAGVPEHLIEGLKTIPISKEGWLEPILKGINLTSTVIYVPHTLKHVMNDELTLFGENSHTDVQGGWHHEDNLFVLLKSIEGDIIGAISVDTSKSGNVPTAESVRPLEIFAFQISEIIQKNRLYDRITSAQDELQLFLDLISHDLKNMNHAAYNSLELLMMGDLTPDQDEIVQGTQNQLMKSENMLQNIRKLLKIRSMEDKSDLKPLLETIEIRPLLEKTIETLKSVYPFKNISITLEGLKSAKVIGDRLLEDVFSNLLDNAIKFNFRKNVKVDVVISKSYLEDQSEWIKIEIKDYGRGIPDSRKEVVFRRFTRHGGKSIVGGSGLGLSIVQGIINRLDGKIWIENCVEEDYQKGANFIVLLRPSFEA
ncbi:MAG: ATP-binding protein [Candidatus Hodarchaeota archaeon]